MKIIKYGEGYPIRITCNKCESILEIELEDIRASVEQFMLKQECTKYIVCPVCGEKSVIEKTVNVYEVGK